MHRRKKELYNNLTILVASLMFSITAILISGPFAFQTADDTQNLYQILENRPKTEVRGAFESDKFCPEEKPIMGWIDFQGNKKIVSSLAENQQPSACFEDVEKAKSEGFESDNR